MWYIPRPTIAIIMLRCMWLYCTHCSVGSNTNFITPRNLGIYYATVFQHLHYSPYELQRACTYYSTAGNRSNLDFLHFCHLVQKALIPFASFAAWCKKCKSHESYFCLFCRFFYGSYFCHLPLGAKSVNLMIHTFVTFAAWCKKCKSHDSYFCHFCHLVQKVQIP